jgi:hypothetical protein
MAGSGRRVFSPGEVLTASNTMNYLMDQTVMNFAGTAARGSAIGTAVSEGMVSYLADSDDVEVYTGASWSPLAFESYVDAKPVAGLVPVIAPTVNFSGGTATANTLGEIEFTTVTSLSLNNIFTSTYRNYKINIKLQGSTTGTVLRLRYRASGSDRTSSLYFLTGFFNRSTGATGSLGAASENKLDIGRINSNADARRSLVTLDISDPQIAAATSNTGLFYGQDATSPIGGFLNSGFLSADVNDGFTIYPDSGTMTGFIQVYGYKI